MTKMTKKKTKMMTEQCERFIEPVPLPAGRVDSGAPCPLLLLCEPDITLVNCNEKSCCKEIKTSTGVDTLFVHNWSKVTNWVYVMLSHVQTGVELFCRKTLAKDLQRFVVPDGLKHDAQKV